MALHVYQWLHGRIHEDTDWVVRTCEWEHQQRGASHVRAHSLPTQTFCNNFHGPGRPEAHLWGWPVAAFMTPMVDCATLPPSPQVRNIASRCYPVSCRRAGRGRDCAWRKGRMGSGGGRRWDRGGNCPSWSDCRSTMERFV